MSEIHLSESSRDTPNRKCKIIGTMGKNPSLEFLVKLFDAGLNICRLNFSHGDHASHGATVASIREAALRRPDKDIAILLDTKGPEIRTGKLKEETITLKKGQDLRLTTKDDHLGDESCIGISYKKLPTAVSADQEILIADGTLVLKVKEPNAKEGHVDCTVMNDATIGPTKNCNLPGVHVDLPVLQDKDKKDLREFAIKHRVQFVAASFVQSAADVESIRAVLDEAEDGKDIKIISKIENQAGLKNFDEICAKSDGIMVARGDLGMEIPPEKVFLAQKIMIAKCNLQGKPVVCATQMLESMIKAPAPTRAEAGDVANAVLDGADAVMLSGETANGAFPEEAVQIMRRIVEEAEQNLDYQALYYSTRENVLDALEGRPVDVDESMASSACKSAADVRSPLIIAFAGDGKIIREIAKYRPRSVIMAVTGSDEAAKGLQNLRGVVTYVDANMNEELDAMVIARRAMAQAHRLEVKGMKKDAKVVLVTRESQGTRGAGVNSTMVKVLTI